ncbi:pentatricopeptide repeat-containing protein At3g62890-like [Mercurialis annua]|uniref:pentatricopeptide repeat-containing protein At3g62890-like n=1 Tax=Mercurialis annua TaxID=3986 RepID=UPI00215DF0F1|nr:pentatricopeptide repeat-containing protein At3g62890-like [Mercurialis annua]XP_050222998.1 pentatricopeptide repeat-containing protein At3g62890-like [Mercurialis annua]
MVELQRQYLSLRNKICLLIKQSKNLNQLKQIHGQILTTSSHFHYRDRHFLISRLLFFIALSNSSSVSYATEIFHCIENPNLAMYNIMIRAYASKINGQDYFSDAHPHQAFNIYKQMLYNGISPDFLTFPFLLKECTRNLAVGAGSSVHGHVVQLGVCTNLFVRNSLISYYSGCGCVNSARKVFDEMSNRDVVSWNSMIIGYLRSGGLDEALDLFKEMKYNGNVITWNSIITGFVQGGRPKEALEFFHEMQCLGNDNGISKIRPDKVTIASVLSACAYLGAIDYGKWVHSYLRRSGLECDMVIGTALVDMYGKCGCIERAYEVFREMPEKDTLAWTAMISVFALHGFGKEAFDMFKEMEAEGVKPNHVTFVGLLSACAHCGLVNMGRWCLKAMKSIYSIQPQVHHYACMVDILGRAGFFEEAEELIRNMPMEPDVFVWGALLGGCQMHGNVQLGEKIAQHLIELDPRNHAFYVNLCDVYAKAGRYTDAKRVRASMNEQGIKKEIPGCSMIEVNGVLHEFSVTGSTNVVMEELTGVLTALSNELKIKGNLH